MTLSKLAGTAVLISLVILTQPTDVRADVTVDGLICSSYGPEGGTNCRPVPEPPPQINVMTLAQYNGLYGYGSTTVPTVEATTSTASTTPSVATPTDQQSEIVQLLQQIIALETQLVQLQNSQKK